MTRINCVPVVELGVKHLVAEYRELPRIYALSLAALERGECPSDHPEEYCLGKGHVRFFYSRIGYVRQRHAALIREMLRRGYDPTFRKLPAANQWPRGWRRHWEPSARDLTINRQRIKERSSE